MSLRLLLVRLRVDIKDQGLDRLLLRLLVCEFVYFETLFIIMARKPY